MKRLTKAILALTASLFLLVSCGGSSGTGVSSNPSDPTNLDGDAAQTTISFRISTGSTSPSLNNKADDGVESTFELTSAWVNIGKIEIKLPDGFTCEEIDFELPEFAVCESENELDDDEDETEEETEEEGEEDEESTSIALDESDEEGESSEVEGDEIELVGPFVYNLMTGESIPPIGAFTMPSGMVQEIEIKIDRLDGDSAPEGVPVQLLGNGLFVEGTFTEDDEANLFSLSLDFDEEIKFENLAGLEISEAVTLNQILITFDINSWLNGVDIGACVEAGDVLVEDDTVIIDEDSGSGECSDIENVIKENIEASGTLEEEDEDDDEDEEDDEDEVDDEDEEDDEDVV